MAEITAQMVKELRAATNAGVLDVKKALVESDGDFEAASDALRKKGLAAAEKKSGREATEGIIGTYIHQGSKVAGMVQINCETDFVARTDQFQQLSRDIAMHIVAASPLYTSRDDVPEEVVAKEKEIYKEQEASSGKPDHIVDRIIEGKLQKWYGENCLLEQQFVRDPDKTIQSLITDSIASLGENIQIGRFERLAIGE
ncbi:MAG: translation elongation factor Ts [Chloroflexota bacterium]